MMCEMHQCDKFAVWDLQWGKLPQQKGQFCEEHKNEIWEQAKPQIAVGLCFWIQESSQINKLVEFEV